jgi:hypothetical protein
MWDFNPKVYGITCACVGRGVGIESQTCHLYTMVWNVTDLSPGILTAYFYLCQVYTVAYIDC